MISPLPLRAYFIEPTGVVPESRPCGGDYSFGERAASPWTEAGMYEPFYLPLDAYPSVIPRVRVRGVMALFLAASILWALSW